MYKSQYIILLVSCAAGVPDPAVLGRDHSRAIRRKRLVPVCWHLLLCITLFSIYTSDRPKLAWGRIKPRPRPTLVWAYSSCCGPVDLGHRGCPRQFVVLLRRNCLHFTELLTGYPAGVWN